MKHLYLSREFTRQARRSGLADESMIEAVDRAEEGKIDADLGGGLIKQRVARPHAGRSGGFRTVIAFRKGERAIFLYLFAKNKRANIGEAELEELREIAKPLMRLRCEQLRELVATSGWREIERS